MSDLTRPRGAALGLPAPPLPAVSKMRTGAHQLKNDTARRLFVLFKNAAGLDCAKWKEWQLLAALSVAARAQDSL